MAWTVWKFELVQGTVELKLPVGAWVLSAAGQNDRVMLWVAVDPSTKDTKPRRFHVVPTGGEIPGGEDGGPGIFHGTAFLYGGALVFHVFEDAQK